MPTLFRFALVLLNAVLALAVTVGCAGPTTSAADAQALPSTIRVGVIATGSAAEVTAQYQHTAADLSTALGGTTIEMVPSTDYFAVVEGLRSKDLDAAFLSSLSYVLGTQRTPLVPLAVGVDAAGQPGYYSYLITKRTDINTPADLKGRTLALAGKLSTSGSLYPGAAMAAAGVDPEKDLRTTRGGNHAANILAVASGQVDAAFVDSVEFDSAVKSGKVDPAAVRVAWKSDRITGSPIVVREDVPAAERDALRQALLGLRGTPEFPLGIEKSEHLVPVEDAVYDPIRALAAAQGLAIEAFKK